jgi:hypothetical protein
VALTEAQVQRYGRQILLREVGGRGQARLLERAVRVEGANAATDVAVAYLAAGGTPIDGPAPAGGFLAGAALEAFNPDARVVQAPFASLAAAGTTPSLPIAVVAGGDGVAYTQGGCPACLAATAATLAPHVSPVDAVLLGSLAALVLQRLALGLDGAGAVRLLRLSGRSPAVASPTPCAAHAAER